MKSNRITIWRLTWSHASGVYWQAQRQCDQDAAEQWLKIFRHDESNAQFVASVKAPKVKAGDEKLALHPATL